MAEIRTIFERLPTMNTQKKMKMMAGLGVLAVATAACGSAQATTFATSTTKAKGNYRDGIFVGKYTGQYARDVVIAKKGQDLIDEFAYEMLSKASDSTISATVGQMHHYLAPTETTQFQTAYQKLLANGDTAKLTGGSASNIDGIDQAPVTVTPAAPFGGMPVVTVSTCGYGREQIYGPNGKLLNSMSGAGNYAWQMTVARYQRTTNPTTYAYKHLSSGYKAVAKCPAN